jgi:hypothetical protein
MFECYTSELLSNMRVKASLYFPQSPSCPSWSLTFCGPRRAQETFMQWDQCRRFYNFLMADNMKKIILSHRYRTLSSVSGGTLVPPTKTRQGTSPHTIFTQLK